MRECLTNIVMIAVTIAWFVPFYQIVTQGIVYADEPNTFILASEVALLIAIVAFGVVNLVKIMRRH